jgi:hypothetical protein
MVHHGPNEGFKNMYKTNAILLIFKMKMKGTPGVACPVHRTMVWFAGQ